MLLTIAFQMEPCFAVPVPAEELGLHFAGSICLTFGSSMEACGWTWGLFALWQMVDYPNKRTNYLGFPSVPGHCREQQRAQHQTCQQRVSWHRGLLAHCPVSLPGIFTFPLFPFLSHFSLSALTPSLSPLGTNRAWSFVATQFLLFGFGWRLSLASICG